MNLLDEQIRQDQRTLLARWGIPFRQIGRDLSSLGVRDADIIPLLHRHKRVTLFRRDGISHGDA